jgi:4-hydroxybenzoate polyprenyltransferase
VSVTGEAATAEPARHGLVARLWTYQAERFPVFRNGALIAAFGASAVCLSAMLRGPDAAPSWHAVGVSIVVLFGFFLQLRVADEHKDAGDDARFRPERPVPRGLVTLAELRGVAIATAVAQGVLAASLDTALLGLLVLVWAYMALMTKEFFVPAWLKARPISYLVSHMAVMPLIDLFATACDWLPAGAHPDGAFVAPLAAFLALSFVNGAVLEIARKAWAPETEREGVETYSRLWGAKYAGQTVAMIAFAGLALSAFVHVKTHAALAFLVLLLANGFYVLAMAINYSSAPTTKTSKGLDTASGVYVLANYLLLGVGPLLVRQWL